MFARDAQAMGIGASRAQRVSTRIDIPRNPRRLDPEVAYLRIPRRLVATDREKQKAPLHPRSRFFDPNFFIGMASLRNGRGVSWDPAID
jgi:hypothetical protein